ncbi:hnh endonuclease [Halorubrum kocurii JCM 14978]|uniref:Hnh endonuclease n=2 Tax=Halorubrum kocurii TaxID=478441 RepID=M0PJZ4_9EURY|nr:hnh endonuclease [Halorubrum kocurii JCM 14978]
MDVLLSHDVLLLQVLDEIGPASFHDVFIRMKVLLSKTAVRERLWVLMGLDQLVTGREEQLVDQDATTGRWGFPDDIATSARGHVPDDRALALQRAEDELVRRALARGCDRDLVGSVFGVTRRNTFHKQYRAAAYAFPLGEFNRGGRPVEPDDDSDDVDETTDPSAAQEPVSDTNEEPEVPDGDLGRVETWGGTADEPGTPVSELLHDDELT